MVEHIQKREKKGNRPSKYLLTTLGDSSDGISSSQIDRDKRVMATTIEGPR